MKKQIAGIPLAVMAFTVTAQAAVVVTTSNEIGNGVTPFVPSYTPLTNDLINGMAPSASSGNFTIETSTGTPALTDGLFPPLSTGVVGSHVGLATGGNGGGSGTQVTYLFTTSNVARVDIYGGWNDNGRDEQEFSIEFSSNGGASWGIPILSGEFNPLVGATFQSATRVRISDNAGNLATGVNAIRVNFNFPVENGYVGYAEIDVVAVPEPGAAGLLGLSMLGLAARRRSR